MILCVFTTADGKISQPVAVHETRHGRPNDYLCFPLREDLPLFVSGELPAPYCRIRRYRYEGWSRGVYQYVEELSGDDKLVESLRRERDALLRANQSLADKARQLEEKLLETKNAVDQLRERL
jgi:hypothetical protein